jgi:hypothetical protein
MVGLGILDHAAIGTPHYQSYAGTRPGVRQGPRCYPAGGAGEFPGRIGLRDECL